MDRMMLYDLIYALAARDGREAALFGSCAPLAREALAHSLAGTGFPELWFELPLAGDPWFDLHALAAREQRQKKRCIAGLRALGLRVFAGENQVGTVSFVPPCECEELAQRLSRRGAALRAGLHCAPLAHESAGTLDTGTVRLRLGPDASDGQTDAFLDILKTCLERG